MSQLDLGWIWYDEQEEKMHIQASDADLCPQCGWSTPVKVFPGIDTNLFRLNCHHCGALVEKTDINGKQGDWLDSDGGNVKPTYDPIMQKLYQVAEKHHIRVRYMPSEAWEIFNEIRGQGYDAESSVGVFDPSRSLIIMRDMNACVLAHELGHAIDYGRNYNYFTWAEDASDEDSISREQVAWEHALSLLWECGFNNWNEFLDEVKTSIGTYYQALENCSISSYLFALELMGQLTNLQLDTTQK